MADVTANDLDKILSVITEQNEREQELAGVPRDEEQKLVDKNIVKSREGSTFRGAFRRIVSVLTGNEKTRTYNIATEMARAFYDFNKKKEKDDKPATLVADSTKKVESQSRLPNLKDMDVKKGSLLLGAIAAVIMLASYLWDNFKGLGTWAMKTFAKLPNIVKALHRGLKGFFTKYTKFVGKIADWFAEGLKGAKAGATGLAKIAGNMKAMLLKMAKSVGTKLLKIFKFLPLVGSLASFVFAYKAYKEGRWMRGTLELLSGIANLVPGPGWIISAALDGGMLLYDILEARYEKKKEVEGSNAPASFWGAIKAQAAKIGNWFVKNIKWIPVLGNLWSLGEGIASVIGGDFKGGMKQVLQGLFVFLPPALQDSMWGGVEWIVSLFSSPRDSGERELPSSPKSFGQKVKEFIQARLKSLPYFIRKPLEWLGILQEDGDSGLQLPSNSMEWANNLAKAYNDVKDSILNAARSMGESVKNALNKAMTSFAAAIKSAKDKVVGWATGQLTEEDLKHTKWAGMSSTAIAQGAYMNAAGLQDRSELPSQLLRAQFQEMKKQGVFTGTLKEFRESMLEDKAKQVYEDTSARLTVAMKEYDRLAREGKGTAKQLEMIRDLTRIKEDTIKTALNIGKAEADKAPAADSNKDRIKEAVLKAPAADSNKDRIKEAVLLKKIDKSQKTLQAPAQLQAPTPMIAESIEHISETNALLATNNALLYDLVNTEKQALNEHKKNKPSVVVSGDGSKTLDGGAIAGSYSSNKPGSKGSYNQSPYSLGASTPHVSM